MKKILLSALAVLVSSLFLHPSLVRAADGESTFQVVLEVAGSSTATANGSSTISFKVIAFNYVCPPSPYYIESTTCPDGSTATKQPQGPGARAYISVSGSGNTLGNTSSGSKGVFATTNAEGIATFILASSTAETKTVTVTDPYPNDTGHTTNKSVTFANPAPPPPAPTPASPRKPEPPTTQAAEPTPPAAPTSASLEIDGQAVTDTTQITVKESEPLTLKGKTIPNGVVNLYIFSTPQEATVTADAEGNWTFVVADLEPGEHHVEATTTDPATQKTSERATIANFTTIATTDPVASIATPSKKASGLPWLIGGAVVFLVLIAAGAVLWWFRRKRQVSQPNNKTPEDMPPPPPQSTV